MVIKPNPVPPGGWKVELPNGVGEVKSTDGSLAGLYAAVAAILIVNGVEESVAFNTAIEVTTSIMCNKYPRQCYDSNGIQGSSVKPAYISDEAKQRSNVLSWASVITRHSLERVDTRKAISRQQVCEKCTFSAKLNVGSCGGCIHNTLKLLSKVSGMPMSAKGLCYCKIFNIETTSASYLKDTAVGIENFGDKAKPDYCWMGASE